MGRQGVRWRSAPLTNRSSSSNRRRVRSSSCRGLGRWIMIGAVAVMSFLARETRGVSDSAGDSRTSLPAAPSEKYLRRFVQECSKFCDSRVGGLDLWLSLGEACFSSGPGVSYRQQQLAGGSAFPFGDNDNAFAPQNVYYSALDPTTRWRWWWSTVYPVIVCAIVTTAGLFGGFRLGSRLASIPKEAWHPML
ncbi:unnamed protein product [Scytosiphon promiscuus]